MKTLPKTLKLKHEIFIIDANLKKELNEAEMNSITNGLINSLLSELEMAKLGPLEIYNSIDPRAPGWSFIQPITTSHISGHYFIEPNKSNPNIHMDFYSCSPFNWRNIIPILHKHLYLKNWQGNFIFRENTITERQILKVFGEANNILFEENI